MKLIYVIVFVVLLNRGRHFISRRRADKLLAEADNLYATGDFAAALTLYDRAVVLVPKSLPGLCGLGKCHM
ncbi:MAG TPA: hypothetical protein VNU93_08305, partial [Verrucomicrobiae bacterium]|nr:hypothetical protein [Verrucomicrobiae bacterium]